MSCSITNFYQLVVIVLSELQTLLNSRIFVWRAELKCSKPCKRLESTCSTDSLFTPALAERDNSDTNGHLFSLLIPRNTAKERRNSSEYPGYGPAWITTSSLP